MLSKFLFIIFIGIFYIFHYSKYSLNDGKKIQNYKNPKISIFIPIYNKNKYIKRSIESIQNQTLKEIEIIAINDFSNDTSLKLLEELAKNDSRIKIINNDRNYGLLYSRAIGILNSKGEYILNLDPDDEFEGKDNLEYLYKNAKRSKVDVVSFGALFKSNNQLTIKCSNFHKIYRQPKLFESAFSSTNNLNDFLIWNKLIKKELYLYAYELFKKEIYNKKWNYHEDNIWSILINKHAKSMRCVNKLIYIYNDFNDSLMKNRHDLMELKCLIYRHEMYKKIFKTKKEEKYLIEEYIELLNFLQESDNYYKLIQNNKKIQTILITIFINFTKTYHYSNLTKSKIIDFLNKID